MISEIQLEDKIEIIQTKFQFKNFSSEVLQVGKISVETIIKLLTNKNYYCVYVY